MKKEKLNNIEATGFTAPEHYFETFDDKLLHRIKDETIIEGVTTNGFTVPDDYFNSAETKILNTITSESAPKVINLFARRHLYYAAGIAASIVLLFALFIKTNTTEELSVEMVENYFVDSDLDSYDLAELLTDANMLEDNFTVVDTDYNQENLENYLLEHADIEAIIE